MPPEIAFDACFPILDVFCAVSPRLRHVDAVMPNARAIENTGPQSTGVGWAKQIPTSQELRR